MTLSDLEKATGRLSNASELIQDLADEIEHYSTTIRQIEAGDDLTLTLSIKRVHTNTDIEIDLDAEDALPILRRELAVDMAKLQTEQTGLAQLAADVTTAAQAIGAQS